MKIRLSQAEGLRIMKQNEKIPKMSSKRILIVDDDPEIYRTLKKRLEFHGFICTSANTVENALDNLEEEKPDLVLLDLGFSGVDGTAFLNNAHLHFSNPEDAPPILVLSCFNDQEIIEHALESGAKGYMTKPYNAQELVSTIHEFLGD